MKLKMKWLSLSSLEVWFTTLFQSNILDIATTSPLSEVNPVTLHLLGQIGIFLSAWIKIGLVLVFGALCVIAKKAVGSHEGQIVRKVFTTIPSFLVTHCVFVVTVNLAVIICARANMHVVFHIWKLT
ncbi:MAG: hypothetical protein NWE97_01640 [Candidatus Bathyarchaeota archaeon]|nr:hypothetical protein [Candidatus Bathyarchaeota archaeon]